MEGECDMSLDAQGHGIDEIVVNATKTNGVVEHGEGEGSGRSKRKRARTTFSAPMLSQQPTKNRKNGNQKSKSKRGVEEEFSWICVECKEAECSSNPDASLLLCDGGCHRPFHYTCAGFREPPPEEEPWICKDCKNETHRCCVCQEYGKDGDDVFKCERKGCGLFFHESCLQVYGVDVRYMKTSRRENDLCDTDQDQNETMENALNLTPHFVCPAHRCWTCTEDHTPVDDGASDPTKETAKEKTNGKKNKKKAKRKKGDNAFGMKKERLFRCLECPVAYHISCIPPTARFHELALLCHEHAATCKLPDLDVSTSLQAEVEAEADKHMAKMFHLIGERKWSRKRNEGSSDQQNLFFPGLQGNALNADEGVLMEQFAKNMPSRDDVGKVTFCLPCDLKDVVHSKPASYRHLHYLRYDPKNRPKRLPPTGDVCQCKAKGLSVCDEQCVNRVIMIECTGDGTKQTGERNPYSNCSIGPSCSNRGLGQRRFAKCKPKREQGKGWGLVTLQPLKKGELVLEYTGEVIDEATKEARLQEWSRDHPSDPNFYIMQLQPGWYIDARQAANTSRFINHSCQPNCSLHQVNVNGYMRIAIVANEDVAAGEFLSYDYQFDTKHEDKFVCRCGAKRCRGTMKGGKNHSTEESDETDAEVWNKALAEYERAKKFLAEVEEQEAKYFSQVDVVVPSAENPLETVAAGPQNKNRNFAVQSKVFLWRNAVVGADFDRRTTRQSRVNRRLKTPSVVDVFAKLKEL